MKRLALATLAAAALALGCVHVHEDNRHESKGGPPPWAPAHGYRHKHAGHELRFDAHLGVYVVVGLPHVYFQSDHYYRREHSEWQRCRNLDKAKWKAIDVAEVPDALVKHYAKGPKPGKGHGQGASRGKGPAKRAD
jgi:hypothetical protein